MITVEAIENPRLWRLALMLDAGEALRAVASSTVDDSTLIQFSIPLDPTVDPLKALEEAVYSTPALLLDFSKVDVLVRTDAYTPLPSELPEEACLASAELMQLLDSPEQKLITDKPGNATVKTAWALPGDIANFLARTFRNPCVQSHISPLLRYFSRKTLLGNTAKLYVHLSAGNHRGVDLLAFAPDGSLQAVTSHVCKTDTDAVYFILACAKAAGLSPEADEILLCGDAAMRDSIMPVLRKYVNYVMPVIFPSAAFRAGREALKAPFPLIILPLCE